MVLLLATAVGWRTSLASYVSISMMAGTMVEPRQKRICSRECGAMWIGQGLERVIDRVAFASVAKIKGGEPWWSLEPFENGGNSKAEVFFFAT